MNRFLKGAATFVLLYLPFFAPAQVAKQNWVVHNPFAQKVFIENAGQFNGRNGYNGNRVLYGATLGGVQLCFTAQGVIYRYDKYPKISPKEREEQEHEKGEDEQTNLPVKTCYFSALWQNTNPNVEIEAKDEVSFYYTYPAKAQTIVAHAFKKLLYKNIYPGIDIEYSLKAPFAGQKGESGLEYTVIVYPGADLSQVKLLYKGVQNFSQNTQGAIVMQSALGRFIAEPPMHTFYKEVNTKVYAEYRVNNMLSPNGERQIGVSFNAGNYNRTKTLVIDPWITNPAFAGKDAAYDLCYDNSGNVYIEGGGSVLLSYNLAKLNSSGFIQWIFSLPRYYFETSSYASFAVDKMNGTSYIGGYGGYGLGPVVYKITSSGIETDTASIGMRMDEIWRMEYNQCMNEIDIAGGDTYDTTHQAMVLNTNLQVLSVVNVLGVHVGYHDMALLSIDNTGNSCYMAAARQVDDTTHANNTLLKCPLPALAPNLLFVPDGYHFEELANNYYAYKWPNGINGMANSPNWVYLYDGATLKRFNKTTGALGATKSINTPQYYNVGLAHYPAVIVRWAGIDVDNCDNVYIGDKHQIDVLDSSLNTIGAIPMDSVTDTVCDLHLGQGNLLYACGDGFVASYAIAVPPALTLTITKTPACSGCNGTATALVEGCGNKHSTYGYLWSNGQTTQAASGLCAGSYTVSVLSHCEAILTDTVTIAYSSNPGLNITASQVNEKCYGQSMGSASVSVTGGSGIYSYLWEPSDTAASSLSNLSAGTYTLTVTDTNGCAGIVPFAITEPAPLFSTSTVVDDSCYGEVKGAASIAVSGGTLPYSFLWNPGGVTGSLDTNLPAGSYYVTTTDSNGCTLADTVAITQPPLLSVSDTAKNIQCFGLNNGYINVSVTGGTPAYLYIWNPDVSNLSKAMGLSAGSYSCVVEDYHRCTDSITALITQPPQLILTAVALPDVAYRGQQVTLSATANGGIPPYDYVWSNGENGQSITLSPITTTVYAITVYDSAGCPIKDTLTVDVKNCDDVYVPNAFSPNGDGQNDMLYVKCSCIGTMYMIIYDRWGNKVFESNSITQGWDGTSKGQPENTGTYVYYIKGTYTDGTSFEKKGNITLVR